MRQWIRLCEGLWWDDTSTVTLYHGTSSAFLHVIREHGLLPPREDIRAFALDVLRTYVPEDQWTPELLKSVDEHAVRPNVRKGDRGAALYFMTRDESAGQGVRGYARSYAKHGGEIAYNVWECACIFLNPNIERGFNLINNRTNPPVQPRFPEGKPIVVQVEVPKDWVITDPHDFDRIKATCKRLWDEGVEWARDAGSLESLYDEVFENREVRITRVIPPEMIKAVYSVNYGDMDDAGRGKPL